MRSLPLCPLLALLATSAAAQERLLILDIHLHAVAANHLGLPPLAMCPPCWAPYQVPRSL
jgi:hypothetical protein